MLKVCIGALYSKQSIAMRASHGPRLENANCEFPCESSQKYRQPKMGRWNKYSPRLLNRLRDKKYRQIAQNHSHSIVPGGLEVTS